VCRQQATRRCVPVILVRFRFVRFRLVRFGLVWCVPVGAHARHIYLTLEEKPKLHARIVLEVMVVLEDLVRTPHTQRRGAHHQRRQLVQCDAPRGSAPMPVNVCVCVRARVSVCTYHACQPKRTTRIRSALPCKLA